jgi:DNA-binding response OmpR family regulator
MENTSEKIQRVCIIDDDESIRDMYSTKFRLEGFDPICAINGEEGLKLIREQKPDIIILDMQMPVKGGLEVLAEMKDDPSINTIPVIILSNLSDEKTHAKVGKFDGAHFYIIKALTTPQKVVDIIHEVLH